MAENDSRRKRFHPVRLSALIRGVLPAEYQSRDASIQQLQAFFDTHAADAVFSMVRVINVTESTLTLAVPSPALVNYLRLHTQELREQIAEQFGRDLSLKIVAQPDAMRTGQSKPARQPLHRVDDAISEQINRSAATVEDETLREALLKLSRSINKNR